MNAFQVPNTPLTAEQIVERLNQLGLSEVRKLISAGRIQPENLEAAIRLLPRVQILERDAMTRMLKGLKKES